MQKNVFKSCGGPAHGRTALLRQAAGIHTSELPTSSCCRFTLSNMLTTVFALVLLTAQRQRKWQLEMCNKRCPAEKSRHRLEKSQHATRCVKQTQLFSPAPGSVDVNSENTQSDNNLTTGRLPLIPNFCFPTLTWIVIFNIVRETKDNKIKIRNLFVFFFGQHSFGRSKSAVRIWAPPFFF